MCRRKLLLTFSLLFCSIFAYAEVITVTSNADAGAGTLREALTQAAANGSTDKDYIYFNLPDLSEAGRTITLRSQLPLVSSNLVIDGSIQSGTKFGASDAKISITVDRYAYNQPTLATAALILNQITNVEIYSLFISGFNNLNVNIGSGLALNAGIIIAGSQNIQLGAVGKGNWINNCDFDISGVGMYGLYNNTNQSDIKIRSNYFGYEKGVLSYVPAGINLSGKNITYGGNTLAEGNHIATSINTYGDHLKISNNYIGIDGNGDKTKYYLPGIVCSDADDVEISYNVSVLFKFDMNKISNFKIYANNDIAYNYPDPSSRVALALINCSNGTIGSDDENLKNKFISNTGSGPDYITACIVSSSSKNIQVLKNEVVCSRYPYFINPYYPQIDTSIPQIQIIVNNDTEYSGTASPLSNVYIYNDDSSCPVCSPLKFYTTVTADVNGKWSITGSFTGKRWVANALLLTSSSEFTNPNFGLTYNFYKAIQPSCGQNNGSIEIVNYKNVLRTEWYTANNTKISEGFKIENIGPGDYYAIVYNGNCSFKIPQTYNLYNVHPVTYDNNLKKTNSSCSKNNGSIKGLAAINNSNNPSTYTWTDKNNKVISHNIDLLDIGPGSYTFIITDNINQCSAIYGPVNIINTTGPNIDETTAAKTSTPCGQSTGSITNLTITGFGTIKYSWKNQQNLEVSTNKDLTNQPAGKYILQVTDETNCGSVYSSAFEIPETNGVTIDDMQKQITIATCTDNNGSITGIRATGATSYQWINSTGKTVSTSLDLTGAAPDNYYLLASNSASCSKQSQTYTISRQANLINIAGTSKILKDASCGLNNGRIEVLLENPVVLPKFYRWQNSKGRTIGGNSLILSDVDTGTYSLYGTDSNGCEKLIISYAIGRIPALQIISGSAQVTNDQCAQKLGSIKGIQITGGKQPYTYKWFDIAGQQIAITPDLLNLSGSSYQLQVQDATDCGMIKQTYTLTNQPAVLDLPITNNLQLCGPGKSFITVNNPISVATYRLYSSPSAITSLDEQANGKFPVNIKSRGKFYISQVIGSCESARAEVIVSVGLSAVNIANTFSPNGDGINDLWILKGIENYPAALVQLYNRYGQKVFESKGYTSAFDGNINNKQLPAGAYYYIINLSSACNLVSGNLTIIR